MAEPPADGARRWDRWLERLSLAAALVPFVVAIVRAGVSDWMPLGDAAYFTTRSRDVFTADWPLVGAWSSGSAVVGEMVNNLGPLQFDLLAPFTKAPFGLWSPYLGTGVGVAATNAGAVVLVWCCARALFGPLRCALVMLGTLGLVGTLGLHWMLDARQQSAMVLPLYALLWLSVAMWARRSWSVPWSLLVGSLLLQTHFSLAYQALLVVGAAGVAYVVMAIRGAVGAWRRTALWSAAVVVVCWAQPLADQLFGTGNLGRVLGVSGGDSARYDLGAKLVAHGALLPPWWFPGAISAGEGMSFAYSLPGRLAAVAALVVWGLLAVGAVVAGRRYRATVVTAVGAASTTALVAALVACCATPSSTFGLTPQNYYWLVALSAFLWIALVVGVSALPAPRRWARGLRRDLRAKALAAAAIALVVGATVAGWPRRPVGAFGLADDATFATGTRFAASLRAGLARPWLPEVVEFDGSSAPLSPYTYVVLVELQRSGIEYRFVSGSIGLHRFGERRCVSAATLPRLSLRSGDAASRPSGAQLIAAVSGFDDADRAELAELDRYFGDQLRGGAVAVDVDAIAGLGDDIGLLDRVLSEPGLTARGLARSLWAWSWVGLVDMSPGDTERFEHWFELTGRSTTHNQYVVLEDPTASAADAEAVGSLRC